MKRKNPATGEHFRRGETREDGYVFFAYTKRMKTSGTFIEIWLKPECSDRATVNDRERKRKKSRGDIGTDTSTNT